MILNLINVTKKYKKVTAVEAVNFSLQVGEVVSIIGPSGSGKSTLLRLIAQLEHQDDGEIYLFGQSMNKSSKESKKAMLQKVGFIFQDFALFDHLTVKENLSLAPRVVFKKEKAVVEQQTKALLARVGLQDKLNAFPSELSGGQKQRVAIARALANNPQLILFDEPTSALDGGSIDQLVDIIFQLKGAGVTVLIVTHDLVFAKKVSTRLQFMEKSRMIYAEKMDE
jgi:ABC-type polar amino acid transport system ATPase subunit